MGDARTGGAPVTRWAIIGGGMLGMTLADRLARHGQDVSVFEAAGEVGGLASAWTLGEVVWDRHYHVISPADTALLRLLDELGLGDDVRWASTRTGFYTDGALYSMSNALEFLRFPPLRLWDKVRLAVTILHASRLRHWRQLERIPVEAWLRRWSGRRTVEKIWLPLLRAKLGDQYPDVSAAFLWAIIARMYAARRSGMKREMFGYVAGGYARVLDRFAAALGEAGIPIHLRHAATRIEPGSRGLAVTFASGRRCEFDRVVVTAAAPLASRLCAGLSADETARFAAVRYQGLVCASVLLRQPLAGFYVTNITDAWVPFTAVIEMSALVGCDPFAGHTLVYLPKYAAPDDPAFDIPDDDLTRTYVDALCRMYPHVRRDDVVCARVSRVRYVLPLSTLHYSDRLPPMQTSVPGLSIVNSAHIVNGTLNVNETIALAERAAGVVLGS